MLTTLHPCSTVAVTQLTTSVPHVSNVSNTTLRRLATHWQVCHNGITDERNPK